MFKIISVFNINQVFEIVSQFPNASLPTFGNASKPNLRIKLKTNKHLTNRVVVSLDFINTIYPWPNYLSSSGANVTLA
jgi:hypothetical protein